MGIGFRDLKRADGGALTEMSGSYICFLFVGILDDGILVVKLEQNMEEQNKGLWNARKGRTKCGSVATNAKTAAT